MTNKRILKKDDSYLFLTSASNENNPIRKLMPPYKDLTSPLPTFVVIAKPTESTKPAGKTRPTPQDRCKPKQLKIKKPYSYLLIIFI